MKKEKYVSTYSMEKEFLYTNNFLNDSYTWYIRFHTSNSLQNLKIKDHLILNCMKYMKEPNSSSLFNIHLHVFGSKSEHRSKPTRGWKWLCY